MFILIFFIAHWYLSLFSQTFFDHRYAAHRSFTMKRSWERVFYLFAYFTQGSSFMSARAYAILHRMHHAYADTVKDPHSPGNDQNIFKLMWKTRNIYNRIYNQKDHIEPQFLKNLPKWSALDRFGHTLLSRFFWIALYVTLYILFSPSAWFFLLIPIHIVMGPVHGVIINWFAHKYGKVRYSVNNTARNLFLIDFFMLGEAYHNNHHKYPSRVNFGSKWYEFDPVHYIILILNRLRIIRICHQVATVNNQIGR